MGPSIIPVLEMINGIVKVPAPIQAAIRPNTDPEILPGSILTTLPICDITVAVLLMNEENLSLLKPNLLSLEDPECCSIFKRGTGPSAL